MRDQSQELNLDRRQMPKSIILLGQNTHQEMKPKKNFQIKVHSGTDKKKNKSYRFNTVDPGLIGKRLSHF